MTAVRVGMVIVAALAGAGLAYLFEDQAGVFSLAAHIIATRHRFQRPRFRH